MTTSSSRSSIRSAVVALATAALTVAGAAAFVPGTRWSRWSRRADCSSASVAALGGAEVYRALGAGDNITYWPDIQDGSHCANRAEWRDRQTPVLGSSPAALPTAALPTAALPTADLPTADVAAAG